MGVARTAPRRPQPCHGTVPQRHLVPPERRFDFSAFACSAWPRSSLLVFTTSTPAPSEAPSPACAWVQTAENLESLHPTLCRIPNCKRHRGARRTWRTRKLLPRETQRPSALACGCTQWHKSMLWPLSAWRGTCCVRCTWWVQPPDVPAVAAIVLHASVRSDHVVVFLWW